MKQIARIALTLLGAATAFGCGEEASTPGMTEPSPPNEALVGDGRWTGEAAEVRQLILNDGSWCTATMIGLRTILTAAHCFNYESRWETTPSGHTFSRAGKSANVLRYESLGTMPGVDDIAVAEIDDSGDTSLISPLDIWPFDPPKEFRDANLYGFGCDNPNWDTVAHDWDCSVGDEGSMHIAYVPNWSFNLTSPSGEMAPLIAHGDSGGPMVVSGKIAGIISEMSTTYRKRDGSLVSTHAVLASVIRNQSFIERVRDTFE